MPTDLPPRKTDIRDTITDAFAIATAMMTLLFIYVLVEPSDRLRHEADASLRPVLMAKTTIRAR